MSTNATSARSGRIPQALSRRPTLVYYRASWPLAEGSDLDAGEDVAEPFDLQIDEIGKRVETGDER